MGLFRKSRRGGGSLGTVQIGVADVHPKAAAAADAKPAAEKNPSGGSKTAAEPKGGKRRLDAPLKMKREHFSLDNEYVELAKKYLGMPAGYNPTVVDLSKSVIKLFEDNLRLIKRLDALKSNDGGICTSPKHSWESTTAWN